MCAIKSGDQSIFTHKSWEIIITAVRCEWVKSVVKTEKFVAQNGISCGAAHLCTHGELTTIIYIIIAIWWRLSFELDNRKQIVKIRCKSESFQAFYFFVCSATMQDMLIQSCNWKEMKKWDEKIEIRGKLTRKMYLMCVCVCRRGIQIPNLLKFELN